MSRPRATWNIPPIDNEALCAEALAVLEQIERGEVTVTPDHRHECFTNLPFTASNEWSFTIFCDGGWDYVDHAVRPDGVVISPFDMTLEFVEDDEQNVAAYASPINGLRCYSPPDDIKRSVWRFKCE